jgi:hypothetical protein
MGDKMSAVRFVYSRGASGGAQIHEQIMDIPHPGEVTYVSLRAAEAQFIRNFTSQFGSEYLIQWEAWSEDRKQRFSTYRAFLPSGKN